MNEPSHRTAPRAQLSPEKLALLERWSRGRSDAAGSRVPRRTGAEPARLSFAQEQVYFLERLRPGATAYNMTEGLRLTGALDIEALRRALQAVVDRHEALRTTIGRGSGDRPVMQVTAKVEATLRVADLSHLGADEAESAAADLLRRDAHEPFDLERGPLFRFTLARVASGEHHFIFTIHHLVFDGWSSGVLTRELAAHYDAFAAGRTPAVATLPVTYADWADWQRARLTGAEGERHVAWWKEQLAGGSGVLELPTDFPRPAQLSARGATQAAVFPRELLAGLEALGEGERATLFMTLMAGWQALLHRFTGQADFCVGTQVSGRGPSEVQELVGFFVNSVPLRAQLGEDTTFRQLVTQVRERSLGAFAHQDVPFAHLVEALQPERRLSRSPVFQVILAVQTSLADTPALSGLTVRPLESLTGGAKFELGLVAAPTAEGLSLILEYSTDLFRPETARGLLTSLRILLAAAVAQPDARVRDLELVDADEAARLRAWGECPSEYPREATVASLFAAQAAASPGRVAVVCGDATLTYAELDRRSNQVARSLRRRGVGPDGLVGIAADRSLELIVGLLGIIKAGGAYVPLDLTYPRERLRLMLDDARLTVVLSQRHLRDRFVHGAAEVIDLDDPALGAESDGPVDARVAPEHLAYVCFTSGSTGQPKGVCVPHRGVVRLVCGTNFAELGPGEVFLQLAPMAFDASTLEVWGPLLHGGVLAVMPPGVPSLAEVAEAIESHGVTVLWLTAGLFRLMVDHHADALREVRHLIAGGDVLSVPHVRKVVAALAPGHSLSNGYGPTENTTFTTSHRLRPGDGFVGSVPIGRPIANTTVAILDRNLRLVPAGWPGELCTGGDGLARGYLHRPELTAERFVAGPAGERCYRTGDLARWLPDGTLEFLGRTDDQVKLRGFRIELGEVESCLAGHPQVAHALATVREDTPGDKRLVAYAVPRGDVTPAALRAYVAERLPEYLVPSIVVLLPELPLSPNGKPDRRALPCPAAEVTEPHDHAPPRTTTEVLLAALWADVLRLERVGVHDGFFESGGHSLLAIRLFARIKDTFGVELPLAALFEGPTVAQIAARLDAARGPDASLDGLDDLVAELEREVQEALP